MTDIDNMNELIERFRDVPPEEISGALDDLAEGRSGDMSVTPEQWRKSFLIIVRDCLTWRVPSDEDYGRLIRKILDNA